MTRPIKFISDSTADLPKELVEKYDIQVLPLTVTLGENNFKDGTEISNQDIFRFYDETKGLPKTSAVSVLEYTEAFTEWVEKGYDVVSCMVIGYPKVKYQRIVPRKDLQVNRL